MEVENVSSSTITSSTDNKGEGHDVRLPGFRFHPTDEELCGFYLRRKVEKRPIRIELIKQADIYKFDPWDLPTSGNVGERERYFFCKRGRKYRNSIRPNRVTASGFWKATGIDRPVYSSGGEGRDCIGLKKSLVYYSGSAGKGSKTDWMMHEFRLPAAHDKTIARHLDTKIIAQEAEVWTLCRIFKRNVSYRRCLPAWRGVPSKRSTAVDANSKTCSSVAASDHQSNYISFNAPPITTQPDQKPSLFGQTIPNHEQLLGHVSSSSVMFEAPSEYGDINEVLRHVGWEDLPSIVGSAASNHYSPFY